MPDHPPPPPCPVRRSPDPEDEDREFTGACLKIIAAFLIILGIVAIIGTLCVMAIIWACKHL